jgi:uncharacterized phage protein (TIGR02218 family)
VRSVQGNTSIFTDYAIGAIALADLWTIALTSGAVLRWTSADVPITVGGQTFTCGPVIKRGATRLTSTLEVDTLDVTFETGGQQVSLAGVPLPHAAANGALDGATVKLERAFMVTWGTVSATVHLFEGRVAGVEPRHTEVRVQVKSLLEILDAKWPRNLYQPTCNHQLYGASCGVPRSANQSSGVATGGGAAYVQWATGRPAGHYDQGVIAFTSGRNVGARRTVKESSAGGLTISLPLPYPVQPGDAFTVAPGCSKTAARALGETRPCCRDYSNLARFRGFPWVPPPETAR